VGCGVANEPRFEGCALSHESAIRGKRSTPSNISHLREGAQSLHDSMLHESFKDSMHHERQARVLYRGSPHTIEATGIRATLIEQTARCSRPMYESKYLIKSFFLCMR
jgi:hypothetical protein